jgi:tripartite ATP-independent transporter DctM subunit
LAAATGVVGASVVAMGLISLPVMLRNGYSKSLATGVIAAAGTLGQIIPPSIVLVVLGDQMGVSVGDLFLGALFPGLLLAGAYLAYVIGVAIVRPSLVPPLSEDQLMLRGSALLRKVLLVMLPPLVLILLVLGSIFAGIATPTEAGALGAVGAIGLAAMSRRLSVEALRSTSISTGRLTAMVLTLLIGSGAFSLVFRGLDGDLWVEDLLTNLPGGRVGFLVVANLAFFVLGCFLDFFEIVFVLLPLLVPAARLLGIDMVWLGVLLGMNLQTSFLTPPFGFALFYLRGVTPPEVSTTDIYRGAIPFIVLQVLALIVVIAFPELVSR